MYVNVVGINYSIYYQYTCIDIYVNIPLRIAVTVSFVSMQSLHEIGGYIRIQKVLDLLDCWDFYNLEYTIE